MDALCRTFVFFLDDSRHDRYVSTEIPYAYISSIRASVFGFAVLLRIGWRRGLRASVAQEVDAALAEPANGWEADFAGLIVSPLSFLAFIN